MNREAMHSAVMVASPWWSPHVVTAAPGVLGDGITSAIRCILAGGAGSAAPRALGEGIACWAGDWTPFWLDFAIPFDLRVVFTLLRGISNIKKMFWRPGAGLDATRARMKREKTFLGNCNAYRFWLPPIRRLGKPNCYQI